MKGSIRGPKNDKDQSDICKEENGPSKDMAERRHPGKEPEAWAQLGKHVQGNRREQRLEVKAHIEVLTVMVTGYIPAGGPLESRKNEKWKL